MKLLFFFVISMSLTGCGMVQFHTHDATKNYPPAITSNDDVSGTLSDMLNGPLTLGSVRELKLAVNSYLRQVAKLAHEYPHPRLRGVKRVDITWAGLTGEAYKDVARFFDEIQGATNFISTQVGYDIVTRVAEKNFSPIESPQGELDVLISMGGIVKETVAHSKVGTAPDANVDHNKVTYSDSGSVVIDEEIMTSLIGYDSGIKDTVKDRAYYASSTTHKTSNLVIGIGGNAYFGFQYNSVNRYDPHISLIRELLAKTHVAEIFLHLLVDPARSKIVSPNIARRDFFSTRSCLIRGTNELFLMANPTADWTLPGLLDSDMVGLRFRLKDQDKLIAFDDVGWISIDDLKRGKWCFIRYCRKGEQADQYGYQVTASLLTSQGREIPMSEAPIVFDEQVINPRNLTPAQVKDALVTGIVDMEMEVKVSL